MIVTLCLRFEIYATSPTLYFSLDCVTPRAPLADMGLKKCDVFDVIPCVTALA
jgi:hypothetical protein